MPKFMMHQIWLIIPFFVLHVTQIFSPVVAEEANVSRTSMIGRSLEK